MMSYDIHSIEEISLALILKGDDAKYVNIMPSTPPRIMSDKRGTFCILSCLRCSYQRRVKLQNPKYHYLSENFFNNIPSILSRIAIWLFV